MSTLTIRHLPGPDPPHFEVRDERGKTTAPAIVPPAAGFPVEGRPHSSLMEELRWYLEDFLEYPFPPETDHAERVLAALDRWGREAFNALFDDRDGGGKLGRAVADGYDQLRLRVWSDDPRVLAWPWEVLEDPQAGPLGQLSQIERCLNDLGDPPPISARLPRDRINLLLVTARPYEGDVAYRSISRPLVELVDREKLPVDVHVLRPPTFERLREHLRERPHHYHILHFDGHGAYRAAMPEGALSGDQAHKLDRFKGMQGRLIFEDAKGDPAPVTAEVLRPLLREVAVPVVVLNACQSGMLDEEAKTAFASVAASLLRAGTRSVVAMAYSLYVSAAQELLPTFYRRLFASGSVAEAVRAGRQRMFEEPGRVCVRGRYGLRDWLVPVLYQQEDVDLAFAAAARPAAVAEGPTMVELGGDPAPHGFVGRDGALLRLERALRGPRPGILVHGLGGIGKTTLARGLVEWLQATEGLGQGCFWFAFQEIRSTEYVLNRLGEPLFGADFAVLERERKIENLAAALREQRFLVVWDNFEVVAGIAGTAVQPTLSAADRDDLRSLLRALRGGATKVVITSRSEESWLREELRKVALSGLRGEERWEYCDRLLAEIGLKVDREDPELGKLMDLLEGHPLAMRVMLPELERRGAGELIAALQSSLAELDLGATDASAHLQATLRFVEEALPETQRPLLVPLALHERFVEGKLLDFMGRQIEPPPSRKEVDALVAALATAGLLRDRSQSIYEMHPALTGFLRSTVLQRASDGERDGWSRAFVDVMGRLANNVAPRPLHEQRGGFHFHGANFLTALAEAERLAMTTDQAALLQALGAFALNQRSFAEASERFQKLAELDRLRGRPADEAADYHQLGIIAREQWYFANARDWCQKSLHINERLGNEAGAVSTYQVLGNIALEQRDFANARDWCQKSLHINERLGNEAGAAITYQQLGSIALEQRDFASARDWFHKSLHVKEKLGNEAGAAITYHDLGRIAQEQRDFATARNWYHKSLHINEKLGDEAGAAGTYHQLGIVAQEQRDFATARDWYQKSLCIKEKLGDEQDAASTYHDIGILAGIQEQFEGSGKWLIKSILVFLRVNDTRSAEQAVDNFSVIYDQAPDPEKQKLRVMWEQAGLGSLPWAKEPESPEETSEKTPP